MYVILSTIPGIHATIVGILVAFFSAFLIFAYQKITEAKKKLEKALKIAESVSSPALYFYNGKTSLINDNGELDWDGESIKLIQDATTVFPHLDAAKHGIDLGPIHRNVKPNEIVKVVDELTPLFYLFFISYPLNGKSIITTPQSSSKERNKELFDYKRYSEIQQRINYLTMIWNSSQESLIYLFNSYDEIKEKKSEIENNFKIQTKQINFLLDFFQRVHTYQAQVMPILDETIIEFETYNNELKVKELTKYTIKTTIYILIVGILIPIILLENINNFSVSLKHFIVYIEYLLLIASFLPYFIICLFFLKKIENTIFK